MRNGGWGKIQVAVRRAFFANPWPQTTSQLVEWTHPRGAERWQRQHGRAEELGQSRAAAGAERHQ